MGNRSIRSSQWFDEAHYTSRRNVLGASEVVSRMSDMAGRRGSDDDGIAHLDLIL